MREALEDVAGPREMIIAAAICAVIFLAFFGGYQLGKSVTRYEPAAESAG